MKKRKAYMLFLCLFLVLTVLVSPVPAKAFDKTAAKNKVTVTYKQTTNGVLAIYKNKNNIDLKLTGVMHFRAANQKDISKETEINYCLGAKSTGTIFFKAPVDAYGNYINYSSYKGSFSVSKSKYKSSSSKISVSSELKVIEADFAAVNIGKKKLSNISTTIVFYDGSGEIIGCKTKYLNCFSPNSVDQFAVDYVSGTGIPSKVKVYINSAY